MLTEPSFDVIARAQRGNHDAFRAIVVSYQHKVHTLLARMLAGMLSLAEVEELAQDAFLRMFRALPSFVAGRPGGLTRWVIVVTSRVGIDALRKRRLIAIPLDPTHENIAPPATHLDAATRAYLSTTLARAVSQLPPGQRAVFVLRDYYDADYDEIAALLSIPAGTVKSRLSRARAALRTALSQEIA